MRRTAAFLVAAAAVSIGLPLGLRAFVGAKVDDAAARVSGALAVPVAIEDADVGLSGTFRLDGVSVGTTFRAESVDASIGLTSLLSGRFGADEVRVEKPTIAASVGPDGTLDVVTLLRRVRDARRSAPRREHGDDAAGRTRRIVVSGGELVVTIANHGELRAHGVELHPQDGGVRVVTGRATAHLVRAPYTIDTTFDRGGFDVTLPDLHVTRAALDGGTVSARAGDARMQLDRVIVSRGVNAGETRIDAKLADRTESITVIVNDANANTNANATFDSIPLAVLAPLLPRAIDLRDARGAGTVTATWRDPELRVTGDVRFDAARIDHALFDDDPFTLSVALRGDAVWIPAAREAQLDAQVTSARLTARIEAALAPGRASAWIELPRTECATALAAIPIELRRGLDGLELSGALSGRVDLDVDAADPAAARLDVDLDVACRVDRDPTAADVNALRGRPSHTLPDGTLRLMHEDDPDFVALDELPSHVPGAWVAGEDARFRAHDGFDVEQIRRSLAHDVAEGRVARGGSTISQQLVKNLWLSRERTLSRKLVEAVLTWRLEQRLGKDRILELYLNLIELGDGVYGVGPAARRWFDKPARELEVVEVAFLAALTPAPITSERRIAAAGRLDPATRARVETILRAMKRAHVIDRDQHARALRKLDDLPLRPTRLTRR